MAILADDAEVVEYSTVGLEPVDMMKVISYAEEVRQLIDYEDEETIGGKFESIVSELNNDERIALATILKESGPGKTTRKTYVSIMNEWLRIERAK